MKIWITGENSVISKVFTDYCKKTNKHTIINSYDNSEYDYWRKNKSIIHEIDIFDPSLENVISSSEAELIIHTAENKNEKDGSCIRTNIMGTYYITEISKNLNIPIIYITSPDCYQIDNDILSSEDQFINSSLYAFSKNSAVNLIKLNCNDYTIVVPGYIYGPKDEKGYISSLIKSHYGKSDVVEMNVDPEAKKSFIYEEDFARALDKLITNQKKYNKIKVNICKEEYISYSEIIEILEEEGLSPEYNFHPEKDIYGDRKLKLDENFKTNTDIKSGLKKTINSIIKSNNLL